MEMRLTRSQKRNRQHYQSLQGNAGPGFSIWCPEWEDREYTVMVSWAWLLGFHELKVKKCVEEGSERDPRYQSMPHDFALSLCVELCPLNLF